MLLEREISVIARSRLGCALIRGLGRLQRSGRTCLSESTRAPSESNSDLGRGLGSSVDAQSHVMR